MNRPQPLLERHLLTRSDLASMQVPAIDVFRWLTEGCLEQVGELPSEEGRGEPVFTVLPDELRKELSEKLAAIGKSTVVLTPLGVRSFLLRAILTERGLAVPDDIVGGAAGGSPIDAALPEELMMSDLAEVLRNAALEVVDDVEAVLELAAEVAANEAMARTPWKTTDDDRVQTTAPDVGEGSNRAPGREPVDADELDDDQDAADFMAAGSLVTHDEHGDGTFDDGEHAEADACFDFDDLTEELGGLDLDENTFAEPEAGEEVGFPEPKAAAAQVGDSELDELDLGDPERDHEGAERGPLDTEREPVRIEVTEDPEPTQEGQQVAAAEPELENTAPAELVDATDACERRIDSENDGDAACDDSDDAVDLDGGHEPDGAAVGEPGETARSDQQPTTPEPAAATTPDDANPTIDETVATESLAEDQAEADHGTEQSAELAEPAEPAEPPRATPPAADDGLHEVASIAASNQVEATSTAAMASVAAMERVETFLGELKGALIEMAQRPQPDPADLEPLVQAVQTGFERAAEQASQTTTALTALTRNVGKLGDQIEQGIHHTVQTALEQRAATPSSAVAAPAPSFVTVRPDRQTLVLGAVAVLVVCWSILFWVKTGSPRLALGTLVGANLIGCCLLLARRDRS